MDNFEELIKQIKKCRDCREIFGFEPIPVFQGNSKAKIIQISQAPSKKVHLTKKSFNDSSGKKLIQEWYKISREDFDNLDNFYISGIAHCYPGKNKNGGDKAPPKKCADKWLKKEIGLVNNRLFILIGRHSAKYFFPDKNFSDLIFSNQEINAKPTLVLPHPSPLNRKWFKDNPQFEKKRLFEIRKIVHEVLFN